MATVVGTLNSGLVISEVIVPLERSGLSVTRTSVFAKFSTTHSVPSCQEQAVERARERPSTSMAALAPVAGSTVNSAPRAVWLTIRVEPFAVASMPLRFGDARVDRRGGAAQRDRRARSRACRRLRSGSCRGLGRSCR